MREIFFQIFFHVTRRVVFQDDVPCMTIHWDREILVAARSSSDASLHRVSSSPHLRPPDAATLASRVRVRERKRAVNELEDRNE